MNISRDADGHLLEHGDTVIVLRIPEWLQRGLPDEDRLAMNDQVGRELVVAGFDGHGHVELEFLAENGNHTIYIDGGSLRRILSAKARG